ncbi:ABC transporter permease [Microbacterium barkeri]|uniref:ABC transporter permease n=1 Tax=Microbacterium barkeri TaxID=33917 RepID=A0A9W6LXI4_9MICO|nr:ABC transporter permease [Microbacterium barkeri]MDI6944443.1 ABC transporter permease [Microbacterium barkeri]MDR6877520.1 NitT/TauT family transport system permease protein [Microbacterium barkeri]GLJ62457.1 ABC transporter permease [Microbacterium barkeri]
MTTDITRSTGSASAPKRKPRSSPSQVVGALAVLAALLSAWQFLPGWLNTPRYVVPPLNEVLVALADPVALPRYLQNAGATMIEVALGLAIGVALGLTLALTLAQLPRVYGIVFPYIVAIESIPKVAVAPLFVIWFGFGLTSKVVVVVLLAFFPVLVNTIHGLRSVDRDQIDLFRVNGASALQTRLRLMIPAALPQIFSGLELAVANAMIGAIVAEFVGAQEGLGVLILQAQGRMETPAVFALLIILSAIGIALNVAVRFLRKRIVTWE